MSKEYPLSLIIRAMDKATKPLRDVNAAIHVRVHLPEHHGAAARADGEVARAVERSPVKLDRDLAVARVEAVGRQPRRRDDASLEHARKEISANDVDTTITQRRVVHTWPAADVEVAREEEV